MERQTARRPVASKSRERDREPRERAVPRDSSHVAKGPSPGRERSTSRKSPAAHHHSNHRMLRVEYRGQPYDWFSLDDMGDIVKSLEFPRTLRENIAHYFGVPPEKQLLFDDETVLATTVDILRALQSTRPYLQVQDAREMGDAQKEQTAQRLACSAAEMARTQQLLQVAKANGVVAAFEAMDTNGDGVVTRTEVAQAISSAAALPRPPVVDARYASTVSEGQIRRDLFRSYSDEDSAAVAAAPLAAAATTVASQPSALWRSGRRESAQFGMTAEAGAYRNDDAPCAVVLSTPEGGYDAATSAVFECLDRNHDGVITKEEFGQGIARLQDQMREQQLELNRIYSSGLLSAGETASNIVRTEPPATAPAPVAWDPLVGRPGCSAGASEAAYCVGSTQYGDAGCGGRVVSTATYLPAPSGGSTLGPPNITDVPNGGMRPSFPQSAAPAPCRAIEPVAVVPTTVAAMPATVGVGARLGPTRMGTPRQAAETVRVLPASVPATFAGPRAQSAEFVDVVLRKDLSSGEQGQRFGFANVPSPDGRALLISWIGAGGLLSRWSQSWPDQAIREGDRIVSVNGIGEDVEVMRAQLQADAVRMIIQRSQQPHLG